MQLSTSNVEVFEDSAKKSPTPASAPVQTRPLPAFPTIKGHILPGLTKWNILFNYFMQDIEYNQQAKNLTFTTQVLSPFRDIEATQQYQRT
jgi:hypothetical protein